METNSINFIRTIQSNWNNISNKKKYNNSIVFIEDVKLIWSNGVYYGNNQLIETTYDNLKILRNNSQLIPGMLYRIIDYITTTTQKGTKSAGHQFDIIVTANSENVLNENARAIQHKSESYNEELYDANLGTDFFVEWGIETEPNTGIDTLCIYKTDINGLDPDSEDFNSDYEDTDFNDVFFYKGNYEYNGESFDVWLKCETHRDGYLIQNDCFHYYLTTPIVENGLIKPELYDSNTLLFYEPFTAEYILSVDNSSSSDYFSNSNLNVWELKYTLDNNTFRFVWADAENGKGVIYYLKDEYNNECPYDFKNILFLRSVEWFNEHSDWCNDVIGNVPNENRYYYTFTYVDENGIIYDASIIGNTLYNGGNYITGVYGNIIKECSSYSIGNGQLDSLFILSNNIFYTTSAYGKYYGCYSNIFGNSCHTNIFGDSCYSNKFGDDCSNNVFGNHCVFTTFGNNCLFNIFGHDCLSNTFEDSCCSNIFRNGCSDNTFGVNCEENEFGYTCCYNTFDDDCLSNTFGDSCYSNIFRNGCQRNIFGNDYVSNTFGNNCSSNTFGNDCSSNTFGNYCSSNTFGNYCINNLFGNNCRDNSFSDYYSSNSFGNSCELNKFGNNCFSNSFGNEFSFNVFGNNCDSNSFGNNCSSNTFGNDCYFNSFGNGCAYNIISNTSDGVFENIKEYAHNLVRNNTFDNDVSFNNIYHQDTGYLQNYHITTGVRGERNASSMNVIDLGLNACDLSFKTTIAKKSNGEIVIYNEADLVPWTYITE